MSENQSMKRYLAELAWRREVMREAKDRFACGDAEGAWYALTSHEREGYPWAPEIPGNMGPDYAHAQFAQWSVTRGEGDKQVRYSTTEEDAIETAIRWAISDSSVRIWHRLIQLVQRDEFPGISKPGMQGVERSLES